MDFETLKEKVEDLDEPKEPSDLPDDVEKVVEFQINHEDEIGDIHDVDHREDLEDVADHFFLEEDHWSIEKVWRWGNDAMGEVHRHNELVAESGPRPQFDFYKKEDGEHFARLSMPTEEGAEVYAKQFGCTFERVEE